MIRLAIVLIFLSCGLSTPYNTSAGLTVDGWKQGHYTLRNESIILSARIPSADRGQSLYELLLFNHSQNDFLLNPSGSLLQVLYKDNLYPLTPQGTREDSAPNHLPPGGSLLTRWQLVSRVMIEFREVEFLIFTINGVDYRLEKNYNALWAD